MYALRFLYLAAVSLAAPTRFFDDVYTYSETLADFYGKVSDYIHHAKPSVMPSTTCNTSRIALPAYASSLPSPTGLKPKYVLLGRGTQVCIPEIPIAPRKASLIA